MHVGTPQHLPGSDNSFRTDGPSGLTGNLWPIHPHRLADELLSSWLVRMAHGNGLKLQTFTTLALSRGANLWNRDVDRCATEGILAALSNQTGSTVEELRGGLLSAYEGTVFERHNSVGNSTWIMPLGIYHRTRRAFGMQFCPSCLFFDPAPYFRRRWRLALTTICDIHGTLMHDRCPSCGAPVIFFRNDLGHRRDYQLGTITLCWQCGFDLVRAAAYSPPAPDPMSLVAMRSMATFLDMGWWFCGDETLQYAHLYFDVLRLLLVVLSSRRGHRLLKHIEDVAGMSRLSEGVLSRMPFEHRPLADRHWLLACALWLLDDWPRKFISTCRSVGVSRSWFARDMDVLPWWFDRELRAHLDRTQYSPSSAEVASAAAYLGRTGTPLAKASISRVLGMKDIIAANAFVVERLCPWKLSDSQYEQIDLRLCDQMCHLEVDSPRRLTVERNRVVFQVLRETGWRPERVLELEVADVSMGHRSAQGLAPLPPLVHGLLLSYLRDVRAKLLPPDGVSAMFIGHRSGGIKINNLRRILGSLM